MKKALVLSSGGVDSTTCVGIAVNDVGSENVALFLSFMDRNTTRNLNALIRLQISTMSSIMFSTCQMFCSTAIVLL